jgi:hypothetical protein
MLCALLITLLATCALASNPSNVRTRVIDTVVPADGGDPVFIQYLANITFHAKRIEVWPFEADEPQTVVDLPQCRSGKECAFDHDPPDYIECLNFALRDPTPDWLCTGTSSDAYYDVLTYYDVVVKQCAHAESRVIKRIVYLNG